MHDYILLSRWVFKSETNSQTGVHQQTMNQTEGNAFVIGSHGFNDGCHLFIHDCTCACLCGFMYVCDGYIVSTISQDEKLIYICY